MMSRHKLKKQTKIKQGFERKTLGQFKVNVWLLSFALCIDWSLLQYKSNHNGILKIPKDNLKTNNDEATSSPDFLCLAYTIQKWFVQYARNNLILLTPNLLNYKGF